MTAPADRRLRHLPMLRATLAALLLPSPLSAVASTLLTFDVAGGVTNLQEIPADYGDRTNDGTPTGDGSVVLDDGRGATPNGVVDYGPPGELPRLWSRRP